MTQLVGRGPDLSYAQGAIDLAQILAAKPAFVGIRASYGAAGADSEFARNRAGLSGKVGLAVLYHFAYPDLNPGTTGAVREADTFCDTVGTLRPGEAVDLDWERTYTGDQVAWVEAWWAEVEKRLGCKRPQEWTYGSDTTLSGLSRDPASSQRHLWLAWYPDGGGNASAPPAPPPGFGAVDVWQHGSAMWAGLRTDDNYVYFAPQEVTVGSFKPGTHEWHGTVVRDRTVRWIKRDFNAAVGQQSEGDTALGGITPVGQPTLDWADDSMMVVTCLASDGLVYQAVWRSSNGPAGDWDKDATTGALWKSIEIAGDIPAAATGPAPSSSTTSDPRVDHIFAWLKEAPQS